MQKGWSLLAFLLLTACAQQTEVPHAGSPEIAAKLAKVQQQLVRIEQTGKQELSTEKLRLLIEAFTQRAEGIEKLADGGALDAAISRAEELLEIIEHVMEVHEDGEHEGDDHADHAQASLAEKEILDILRKLRQRMISLERLVLVGGTAKSDSEEAQAHLEKNIILRAKQVLGNDDRGGASFSTASNLIKVKLKDGHRDQYQVLMAFKKSFSSPIQTVTIDCDTNGDITCMIKSIVSGKRLG